MANKKYRDSALARGLCGVCLQRPKMPRSRQCFRCSLTRTESSREVDYEPLDAILEHPRIRILRAMRRLDWSPAIDILEAVGFDSSDAREWNRGAQYLRRLYLAGEIDRRGKRGSCDYLITAKGRAVIDEAMIRYMRQLEAA